LKIVRVRADLRAASEINEFQATLLLLLLLVRKRVRPRLFADTSGQTVDQPHQHRNNLNSCCFPDHTAASSDSFLATRTSRQAAHSNAEPRAKSRNRQRSLMANLPFPSAMLSGILVEARSS